MKPNEPELLDATILFADMVDSSTLSHVLDPVAYDRIVADFQRAASHVVKATIDNEHTKLAHVEAGVRGDELSLILGDRPRSTPTEEGGDHLHLSARIALQVAIRLKRHWLLVDENQRRIKAGQPPLGIAIGMHAGPVALCQHTRFALGTLDPVTSLTAEGYAINIAKRVETASRIGRFSRIFLTRPIYNLTPADFRQAFVRIDGAQLKGISQAPVIYEAKGFGHFDDKTFPQGPEFDAKSIQIYEQVIRGNPHEIWLLLDLAHKYFDDGWYSKAAEKYEAVIEADPAFAPAYAYLGRAHFRDLRYMEAESALERSVELDPGQARANNFLGVCLRRVALFNKNRENMDKAVELFRRAILQHEKARRIAELQGMDFPWARNALNFTIAQCHDLCPEVLPYDLASADKDSEQQYKELWHSHWKAKAHLVSHTKALIAFKMNKWDQAKDQLDITLEGLEARHNLNQIDRKGYAEQKAEVLFHQGLLQWHHQTDDGRQEAIDLWRQAKQAIDEAWASESVRAWNEQYWSWHQVDKRSVRDLVTAPQPLKRAHAGKRKRTARRTP